MTMSGGSTDYSLARSVDHMRALFDPRAVVVVGASTHPGKFGLAVPFTPPIWNAKRCSA
jgi:hypothetical protein